MAASYSMGTGGCFLEGKAAGRETEQSSPSFAEVKNGGSYIFTPTYVFNCPPISKLHFQLENKWAHWSLQSLNLSFQNS
jgi:hypothetical protein